MTTTETRFRDEVRSWPADALPGLGRRPWVHGGIGMTWVRPTHVHYKRAWVDRAALSSSRHQRARIVDALTAATTGRAPMYRTAF